MQLEGKTFLITGGAHRLGRAMALSLAAHGADVVVHYNRSGHDAAEVIDEISKEGHRAWALQADLADPAQAADLIPRAFELVPLDGLVNSAALFADLHLADTRLADWQEHLAVNLTAPFLLTQSFAALLPAERSGAVVNLLDWRALRPGADHLPYTVSKAALAALTSSLAVALAPRIRVNGLVLGAILPPSDGASTASLLASVPAGRWGTLDEVGDALAFLLAGPAYVTGELLYLDGGRHLV
jgi:NAD(P)-dependent dehydrogenase (short-subunit alcohol dehydrogenase family)